MAKVYHVIEDDKESVDYIPCCWMISQNSCYWPRMKPGEFNRLRTKHAQPNPDWEKSKAVTIKATKQTEIEANNKVEKMINNLSSSDVNGKRRRFMPDRYVQSSASSLQNKENFVRRTKQNVNDKAGDSSPDSSSDDDLPIFLGNNAPKSHVSISSIPQSSPKLFQKSSVIPHSPKVLPESTILNTSDMVTSLAPNDQPQSSNNLNNSTARISEVVTLDLLGDAQFKELKGILKHIQTGQKLLFTEIGAIKTSVLDIERRVNAMTLQRGLEIDLPISLPCPDEENFVRLSEWLEEGTNSLDFAKQISLTGGSSVQEVVRRILYKVMTPQLMLTYSYAGVKEKTVEGQVVRKTKKVFKNTAFYTCLKRAVLFSKKGTTDKGIEIAVQDTLKYVKFR